MLVDSEVISFGSFCWMNDYGYNGVACDGERGSDCRSR